MAAYGLSKLAEVGFMYCPHCYVEWLSPNETPHVECWVCGEVGTPGWLPDHWPAETITFERAEPEQ